MDKFIKKNIYQRIKMSIPELGDYYKNLRRYQFEQRQPLKGIRLRKYTLGLYAMLLKLDRILSHEKISLLKNEFVKTKRPVVFAVTHVGGFDVARVYELLRPKAYMLFGDPGDIYKSPYGLLAFSIGWIPFDTSGKTEREIATFRAEELLSRGGNVLIFPEGAWNFSDELPVRHIYNGAARIALHANAEIVPIAIELYGRKWYVNVGKNIDPASLGLTDEVSLTEYLRNQLATLKWEIWEQAPEAQQVTGREKAEWEDRIRGLCVMGDDFSTAPDFATRFLYHDATDTLYKQRFSHLEQIVPRLETAFLFNKRNHN